MARLSVARSGSRSGMRVASHLTHGCAHSSSEPNHGRRCELVPGVDNMATAAELTDEQCSRCAAAASFARPRRLRYPEIGCYRICCRHARSATFVSYALH